MRESKTARRERAKLRGLEFIYRTACDPENFSVYGFDYLFSFHWISSTSRDASLRRLARKMGQERARDWRSENVIVPNDADTDDITHMVFGNLAANRFGILCPFRTEPRWQLG
jgi:hypothetical protein